VKFLFSSALLFLSVCLYSQTGAGNTGGPLYGAGFRGLFRIPDFESPRAAVPALTPLASDAVTGAADRLEPGNAAPAAPLWLRDMRRAEIIAFGSFPMTLFWTSFFFDLYRSASHGWDRRYAPWPFKSAGAVEMTSGELSMMFTIAISSSVLAAVADHFIMRYRRSKEKSPDPARLIKLDRTPGNTPEGNLRVPGD
jgi:hypothetical protein